MGSRFEVFVWKVPDGNLDQTLQHRCVSQVQKMIPTFENRTTASIFWKKYVKIMGITPVVRRSLVEFLTGKEPE